VDRAEIRRRLRETFKDCILILLVVSLYSLGILGFEWTVILLLVCIGFEMLHWSRLLFHQIHDSTERLIEDLGTRIADIPIKEQAQYRKYFDSASTLTIEDIRQWRQGEIIWLVERCYFYPSSKPDYQYWEYKYDRIENTKSAYRVNGYIRLSENHEWESYELDADESECTSGAGSCEVRRVVDPV
jgi:hypothetical protein